MKVIEELQGIKAMSDEEIVKKAANNDKAALEYILDKYKGIVKIKARPYFIIGADKEDIIQEGMIGLYKAIRDYHPDRETSFKVFAELCITRQMITAVKTANRQKHMPLNDYISLNKPVFEEEADKVTYGDTLAGKNSVNPEELFIGKESKIFIEESISKELSKLEKSVLDFYLQGKNYSEISAIINKPEKSIDNALQRVKKKLDKFVLK